MTTDCDYLILGAGIYGSYIARRLGERGASVVLADCDPEPFTRASYINQARVHNGYHYPRSLSTAAHSARYFERFNEEFSFAINNSFKKIYAISRAYSMTSAEQFEAFCRYAGIPCEQISAGRVFAPGTVDAAFETLEYSFDAHRIRDFLMGSINDMKNVSVRMNARFDRAERDGDRWRVGFPDGSAVRARHVINATYAATNQVLAAFGFEGFRLKYEIAEVTLCRVAGPIEGLGVTVMDGPFFSLMPFGLGGEYSLTSVIDTPRRTSYEELPTFDCQWRDNACSPTSLANCNTCPARPRTSFARMHQMAKKYLREDVSVEYSRSLFAIKPLLQLSDLDDSRPTLVRTLSAEPGFTTVLSGKINTMYDLDVLLDS